jgi:NAD(P)-dependent dehydrogenase (short-subunit alcohol dehydrogenase family)
MKTLQDKVVVITGAGSGIGRALAVSAAKMGAKLCLSDWNEAGLAETVALTQLPAARVLSRKLDVRSDEQMAALAAAVQSELGGADVVVNNAGVSLSQSVATMSRTDFEWIMDINFWGVVRGTEAFLPQLTAKSEAHLVNVSSIFGVIAVPRQSAYNASKFAVRGFTEALAEELRGSPVHVSVVLPGGVRTSIITNGRQYQNLRGEPTDTASMAKTFDKLARTTPEEAAATIWSGVLSDAPRILIGQDARVADIIQRIFPTQYSAMLLKTNRFIQKVQKLISG